MELRRLTALGTALIALMAIGCGPKEVTSADVKAPDPYAGMTKEQKIEAIQNDPKINDMQKQSMIADAQKGN